MLLADTSSKSQVKDIGDGDVGMYREGKEIPVGWTCLSSVIKAVSPTTLPFSTIKPSCSNVFTSSTSVSILYRSSVEISSSSGLRSRKYSRIFLQSMMVVSPFLGGYKGGHESWRVTCTALSSRPKSVPWRGKVDEVGEPRGLKNKVRPCAVRRSLSTETERLHWRTPCKRPTLMSVCRLGLHGTHTPQRCACYRALGIKAPKRAKGIAPGPQRRSCAPPARILCREGSSALSICWRSFKVRNGVTAAGFGRWTPHFWTLTAARLRGFVPPSCGTRAFH